MIKGPTEPVLEGDIVTLECLYTDGDLNISQVHFEYFSEVSREELLMYFHLFIRFGSQSNFHKS